MRIRTEGCALCGSTWGDCYEEVEGTRFFFCCDLCARQLRALCAAIRNDTGWAEIAELELAGNRYGREATARHGGEVARYRVRFNVEGDVNRFVRVPEDFPDRTVSKDRKLS